MKAGIYGGEVEYESPFFLQKKEMGRKKKKQQFVSRVVFNGDYATPQIRRTCDPADH
jgi:hypothetical protein